MKIAKDRLKEIIKEEINDLQIVVENRGQEIVDLISDRISEVGFGDENEEDFDAAKVELEEDGLASEQELEQITFERWQALSGVKEAISEDLNERSGHWTDSRDLCMRLAQRHAVDWDSDLQKYLARKGGDQKQCCMCGGAPPGTRRGPDGRLEGVDYFDPKDPAQKKACLGF